MLSPIQTKAMFLIKALSIDNIPLKENRTYLKKLFKIDIRFASFMRTGKAVGILPDNFVNSHSFSFTFDFYLADGTYGKLFSDGFPRRVADYYLLGFGLFFQPCREVYRIANRCIIGPLLRDYIPDG